MVQLQMSHILRPGTQERWRRLYQEVAGSRKDQFERSCQHLEITQIEVMIAQLFQHELMLITVEAKEPQQTLLKLIRSESPFDRWLKSQVESLLGWNMNILSDPHPDLIFAWRDDSAEVETPGFSGCMTHLMAPFEP